MNTLLFKEHTDMLLNILLHSNINKLEKEYRKKKLLTIYEKMKKSNVIDNEYYNISHEIRSLEFLNKYENMCIAQDHLSKNASCDFKIYENYEIECVCSSRGNEKINGLDKFPSTGVCDYNKKETILLTRLTQSIREKKIYYDNHIKNGSINKNSTYIIFLGLGNLTYGMFSGKLGFVLNKILFGVGHDILKINIETNKIEKMKYSHNSIIYNHNSSEIDCNIFCNKDYQYISAIIFSTASLESNYNENNTFLFINPMAKNKIKVKNFPNMIYWKLKRENNDYLYIPRLKGKNINYLLNKKYW